MFKPKMLGAASLALKLASFGPLAGLPAKPPSPLRYS